MGGGALGRSITAVDGVWGMGTVHWVGLPKPAEVGLVHFFNAYGCCGRECCGPWSGEDGAPGDWLIIAVGEQWSVAFASVVSKLGFDRSVWESCPLREVGLGFAEGTKQGVYRESVKGF